ncbi:hypothetical protein E2C01_075502 [Portunus trituberculatus]|uniref:Uncharacterized protein n=1 Tax=Portunus trituberculatus TaxID=210409 RepID=A0A5B7IF77_PORTR|nr:hypothetical protein [Portunus trituberculatus]
MVVVVVEMVVEVAAVAAGWERTGKNLCVLVEEGHLELSPGQNSTQRTAKGLRSSLMDL